MKSTINKKKTSVILILAMVFTHICGYAEIYELMPEMTNEQVTFIVEMEEPGVLEMEQNGDIQLFTASGRTELSEIVHNAQTNAICDAQSILNKEVEMKFTHVMNGFTISGNADMLDELKAIDGVKNVYISREIFHTMTTEEENIYSGYSQDYAVGLDKVWDNYTGKGTVIGIIDSELDLTHPAFNTIPKSPAITKSDIESKLADNDFKAEQLNTDTIADNVYISEKVPFVFDYVGKDFEPAYSSNYHGTHVTGIAAGKTDNFRGVASDAQIVFMKCARDAADAGFSDDVLIAALEDMIILDVDVINMSLGADSGFSSDVYDNVLSRVEGAGITISAAAGNSGRMAYNANIKSEAPLAECPDYGLVATPSTNAASMSVAAAEIPAFLNRFLLNGVHISYMDSSQNYMSSDFYNILKNQTIEYVYYGLANGEDEYSGIDLTGKIALVDRGTNTFEEKVENSASAGAVGVVIANTDEEYIIMGIENQTIPAVMVSKSSGNIMKESEIKEITISDGNKYIEAEREASMASYSSWGVTPDLKLKPEITAIGSNVYSAAYNKGYSYNSGTSMAAPQYSGSTAVVTQYQREVNNQLSKSKVKQLVQQRLCSSAVINESEGVPVTPRNQGAGIINVKKAIDTPVVLYRESDGKTKIELGDKLENTVKFEFIAENLTGQAVTYSLDGCVLTDDYETVNNKNLVTGTKVFEGAELNFSCKTITIPANSQKGITVTATLDSDAVEKNKEIFTNGFYIDGFVRLTSEVYPVLSIPFVGFVGNWLDAPAYYGNMCNKTNATSSTVKTKMYSDETGFMGLINRTLYTLNRSADGKKIYYSGSVFSGFAFIDASMRNIKTNLLSAYNSQNENVRKWEIVNSAKVMFDKVDANVYCPSISDFEDGDYTFVLQSTLDYENAQNSVQSMELNLCIDTEKPTVEAAYIKDGILYAKAVDNNEIALLAIIKNSSIVSKGKYDENSGLYYFNLSGVSLSGCSILVADMAQNSVRVNINTGYEAIYEPIEEGTRMKSLRSVNIFTLDNQIINLPVTEQTNIFIKYFLWDKNLKPLTETKVYDFTD